MALRRKNVRLCLGPIRASGGLCRKYLAIYSLGSIMKNLRHMFVLIMALSIAYIPLKASAQNFSDTFFSFHSSLCDAINPAQSQMMEWRETGLINRDPNNPLWVMCPIPTAFHNNVTQDSYFGVVGENASNQTVQLRCILRYSKNQSIHSESKTISMGPGGRAEFFWEVHNTQLVGPAVQCELPPNVEILGLIGGAGDTSVGSSSHMSDSSLHMSVDSSLHMMKY